jgi:hypothetical protein
MPNDGRLVTLSQSLRLGDVIDLAAALTALGLLAVFIAGGSGTPRILLALGFTFFVPGRAIVTNWPLIAGWSEAAMAMLLSLTVLALGAAITLWAHLWHPAAVLAAEAGLSMAGLAAGVVRRHRARRPALAQGSASTP